MRIIALFVMLFIGVAIFSGDSALAQSSSTQKHYGKKHVTIKSGDTLSKVAKANDTTYKRLFDANSKIKNPNLIYPGDKVRIPHPKEKLKSRSTLASAKTTKVSSYRAPAQESYSYQPKYQAASSGGYGNWDRLAGCESGGNWSTNTGNGYYGGLQFSLSSWKAVGGSGYPHQASKSEQIARAKMLQSRQGWGAWPACSAKLGIS